jgi:hypothetical protein
MYPEEISKPASIGDDDFFRQEEGSVARVVLAAYLLLAGALFVRGGRPDDSDEIIPPDDELWEVGIRPAREFVEARRFDLSEFNLLSLIESARSPGRSY